MNRQFQNVTESVGSLWRTAFGNLTDLVFGVIRAVQDSAPHHQVIIGLACVVFTYVCIQAFNSSPKP